MSNPVSNAISEVQFSIPPEILNYVFGRESFRTMSQSFKRHAPVSVEEMIRSKVIRPRVLKDANLLGGRHAMVSLEGLPYIEQDPMSLIYSIPSERVGNREIMSVLSVSYMPMEMSGIGVSSPFAVTGPVSYSDVTGVGQRIMDSYSNLPHSGTASCELVGYNTVVVSDSIRPTAPYVLRCMLANDEGLSNLSPRSWKALAKAVTLAVKAYVYNELVIQMDRGRLEQGQELGRFREIVDQYSEANEQYQEYLTNTFQKVLFMNDRQTYERFINMQIHPAL